MPENTELLCYQALVIPKYKNVEDTTYLFSSFSYDVFATDNDAAWELAEKEFDQVVARTPHHPWLENIIELLKEDDLTIDEHVDCWCLDVQRDPEGDDPDNR